MAFSNKSAKATPSLSSPPAHPARGMPALPRLGFPLWKPPSEAPPPAKELPKGETHPGGGCCRWPTRHRPRAWGCKAGRQRQLLRGPARPQPHRLGHAPCIGPSAPQGARKRQKTGEKQQMKELYGEGIASHTGPESCASGGNVAAEALTGVRAGQVLSRENGACPECRRHEPSGRQDLTHRQREMCWDSARSKTLRTHGSFSHGNWEIPCPTSSRWR
jgi:hypothetical protein